MLLAFVKHGSFRGFLIYRGHSWWAAGLQESVLSWAWRATDEKGPELARKQMSALTLNKAS